MITQQNSPLVEWQSELPKLSPEPPASFAVAVNFLDEESFMVELERGAGPAFEVPEAGSWQFDPLWTDRQSWPGLEADE